MWSSQYRLVIPDEDVLTKDVILEMFKDDEYHDPDILRNHFILQLGDDCYMIPKAIQTFENGNFVISNWGMCKYDHALDHHKVYRIC